MFKKIDHIGIAVDDLEKAIERYTLLFGEGPHHIEEVPEQQVKTAFFRVGESNFELLQSTSEEGPIGKFIARIGRGGIHHVSVEVEDIEATLKVYKEAGFQLVDEKSHIGAHNKKVAFVHPKSTGGILLELSQNA